MLAFKFWKTHVEISAYWKTLSASNSWCLRTEECRKDLWMCDFKLQADGYTHRLERPHTRCVSYIKKKRRKKCVLIYKCLDISNGHLCRPVQTAGPVLGDFWWPHLLPTCCPLLLKLWAGHEAASQQTLSALHEAWKKYSDLRGYVTKINTLTACIVLSAK